MASGMERSTSNDYNRAQKALTNPRQLQATLNVIPAYTWYSSSSGGLTFVNKRTADYLGLPKDHPLRLGIDIDGPWDAHLPFLHPDDHEETRKVWSTCLRTGEAGEVTFRVRNAEGGYRWFLSRAEPLRASDGTLLLWVGVSLDIEELKRVQASIAEAGRELRQMIDAIPIPVASYGADARRDFVNAAWKEYTGLSDEAALGTVWSAVAHPDHVAPGDKMWRDALATGKPWHTEERVRRADGEYHWFAIDRIAARDENGKIIKWYGTAYDIEDRKRAEDTLRRSEAWLAQAQKLSRTGTWVMNGTTRRFLYWSDESYRIWGFDPQQGLPSRDDMWGRIHPDDRERLWEEVQEALREQRDFFEEFRILLPDGRVKYLEANTHHEFSPLGELLEVVCTNVEVTERKRARDEHERLRQLEADFAHMNRVSMMGELAASLSHEILHPIATARNNARAGMRFLEMNPPNLDEAREALACVVRDADRAKDIVGRIRNQIRKAPPRKEWFGLNEAINEVIVMVRSAIADNRVSVQTRLAEGALAIHGDRVQLQQVLLNLILNAVEAMGLVEAGARELMVSTEQDRTDVLVAVRDSGPGIDATHLERVFEAFYTTKSGGTGMGLLICRSIIDAHGGKLWAEANKPRGAVFQFSLPATQEDS
jgi:PAS domain S-box-containing protein